MVETIRVKAITVFTHYVPEHGMVHGDPNNDDEAAQFPMMPVGHVAHCVGQGWIEEIAEKFQKAPKPPAAEKLTDVVKSILNPADPEQHTEAVSLALHTAKHIGGGYYMIDGPDAPANKVKVKKDEIPAFLAALDEGYRARHPLDPAETEMAMVVGEGGDADASDEDGDEGAPIA
jgi:hypothetical protein